MFDFRLKVFDTVAKRLNFTKAANELNITQPAVSKHIKEIEQQLNTRLFDRNGTKIALTASGKILMSYTEKIFALYRELEFDINQLSHRHKGVLRIGASTTIAQYVLPPLLAAFHKQFKEIKILLSIDNTEEIEKDLELKKTDLGLIEGKSKNKSFQYTAFLQDEIVLAAAASHPLAQKRSISKEDLKNIPLLFREPGSGTQETIAYALKSAGIKMSALQTEMQLANTESIKLYLMHSDCMAFVSIHSILDELKNNMLAVIDIKDFSIPRSFYFIQPQGAHSAIVDLFIKYTNRYNFK